MPERSCVGCRRRRPQADLVRVVLTPDGAAVSRTAPGRGAWLCAAPNGIDGACLELARRRRGFERAWRRPVPVALDGLDGWRPGGKPAKRDDDEHRKG